MQITSLTSDSRAFLKRKSETLTCPGGGGRSWWPHNSVFVASSSSTDWERLRAAMCSQADEPTGRKKTLNWKIKEFTVRAESMRTELALLVKLGGVSTSALPGASASHLHPNLNRSPTDAAAWGRGLRTLPRTEANAAGYRGIRPQLKPPHSAGLRSRTGMFHFMKLKPVIPPFPSGYHGHAERSWWPRVCRRASGVIQALGGSGRTSLPRLHHHLIRLHSYNPEHSDEWRKRICVYRSSVLVIITLESMMVTWPARTPPVRPRVSQGGGGAPRSRCSSPCGVKMCGGSRGGVSSSPGSTRWSPLVLTRVHMVESTSM